MTVQLFWTEPFSDYTYALCIFHTTYLILGTHSPNAGLQPWGECWLLDKQCPTAWLWFPKKTLTYSMGTFRYLKLGKAWRFGNWIYARSGQDASGKVATKTNVNLKEKIDDASVKSNLELIKAFWLEGSFQLVGPFAELWRWLTLLSIQLWEMVPM